MRFLFLLVAGTICFFGTPSVSGIDPNNPRLLGPGLEVIQNWLNTNANASTLRIDFTQTRTMKSLKMPIRQNGVLWLDYGTGHFRWQTGDPPQTVVTKQGPNLIIARIPGKKFEVRPTGSGASPGMGALATGFPKSLDEFQLKYHVIGMVKQENIFRIKTKPLGPAGRGIGSFTFVIESDRYRLLGIEIDLEDGSILNTVFDAVDLNTPVPPELFTPDLTGFKQVEF